MIINCNLDDNEYRIFINEDLTQEVPENIRAARDLKSQGYKYVWYKNAAIYAGRGDASNSVRLRSQEDSERFKKCNYFSEKSVPFKLLQLNVKSLRKKLDEIKLLIAYSQLTIKK